MITEYSMVCVEQWGSLCQRYDIVPTINAKLVDITVKNGGDLILGVILGVVLVVLFAAIIEVVTNM